MRLAMSVGDQNHYRINEVLPRHYLQTAKASGVGVALIEGLLAEITAALDAALDETTTKLPAGFPMKLAEAIADGIRQRSRFLD